MKEEKLRTVTVKVSSEETFNGYFHGWNENINREIEGKEFVYKTAIIEKVDTGEVIEVDPVLITFTD